MKIPRYRPNIYNRIGKKERKKRQIDKAFIIVLEQAFQKHVYKMKRKQE